MRGRNKNPRAVLLNQLLLSTFRFQLNTRKWYSYELETNNFSECQQTDYLDNILETNYCLFPMEIRCLHLVGRWGGGAGAGDISIKVN